MKNILFLIDIDQTLANNSQREHLLPNWEAFFKSCDSDTPISSIIDSIQPYLKHPEIECVFLTGRAAYPEVQEKTQAWLKQYVLNNNDEHYDIFYRPLKDFRKSHIFKESVLNKIKKEGQTVVVLDDDIKIIEHFKKNGHKTILVDSFNLNETTDYLKRIMSQLITPTPKSIKKNKP